MRELQKKLLNIIQGQFPIDPRPFATLAEQLDTSEAEIIDQVEQLKQNDIIRRIGPSFDAARLGYVSTLVAVQVAPDRLDAFVADVNALLGVSHNYGRDHKFNVWFTLTMESPESIERVIERLRRDHQLPAIYSLPAEKLFKIRVNFDFVDEVAKSPVDAPVRNEQHDDGIPSSQFEIALIRRLQGDLPIVPEPFHIIATDVDADINDVLSQIDDWIASGVIRRFGAGIRHQNAGFRANGMVVFKMEADVIDAAGKALAGYPQVSHCYQRPTAPGWPYNLFAMTHCRSDQELREVVDDMVAQVKPKQYDIVLSVAEYKKTNVKYFLE